MGLVERNISRRAFIAGIVATGALGAGIGPETPADVGEIWSITNDLLLHGVRPPAALQEFAPLHAELEYFRIPADIAREAGGTNYVQTLDMVHAALYENGLTNTQVGTTHDPELMARITRPLYVIEPWNAENEVDLPGALMGLLHTFARQPRAFLDRALPPHIVIAPSVKKINMNECSRMEQPYHGIGGFFRPTHEVMLLAKDYTDGFAPAHELFHSYMRTLSKTTADALLDGTSAISKRAFHGANPYSYTYECNSNIFKKVPVRQVFTREYSSKSAEEDLANVYADIVQGSMIVDEHDPRWNTEYHLKQQLLIRYMEGVWPTIGNSFRRQANTV